MNRTVCGICWALYDDEGRCECPQVQEPHRRTGLPHCERSCEANAFQIEIRRLKAALEQPYRLTDDQIARVWFAAKIPGLNETDARRLIRAAERVYMETPS